MRRLPALLLAALMLFATAACGEDASTTDKAKVDLGQDIEGLTVSGEFGEVPTLEVDSAIKVSKPTTEVISAGEGDPVEANKKAMFNILLAKGSDGSKLFSSAEEGTPVQVTMKQDEFFQTVIDALVGKPQGSRVALAATVEDVWGDAGAPQLELKASDTVVFVVDVLSVQPTDVLDAPEGEDVAAPADAPVVEETDGKVTGFDFSTAPEKAPTELQVIPLVEGEGPEAQAGRLVTFNYYGAVWGSDKAFDSSFERGAPEPFGVGVNGLIKAWDETIPGLKQGSRVLIIAPPGDAYGATDRPGIPKNSTLTFVVDVLGVDG